MLQPYIRVVGGPQVIAALRKLARNTTEIGLKRAMIQFGRFVFDAYKRCVPVDTGLSRRSLRYGIKEKSNRRVVLWIGPSTQGARGRQNKRSFDYLHFPDHGTKYIRAQRFAGKAFRRGRSQALPILMRNVRNAINASKTP